MQPLPPSRGLGPGLGFAISSYVLWGFLPLLFLGLVPSGPVEIVAWRIVLSLVFCALLLTVTRSWRSFLGLLRDRSAVITLAIAGALVLVNWSVFIFAVTTNHVVEASLGYFTNPIVTVLLGVFVLRERLRPLQRTTWRGATDRPLVQSGDPAGAPSARLGVGRAFVAVWCDRFGDGGISMDRQSVVYRA